MSRTFTGGANTTMLNRTVSNPAGSVAFSIGCWVKFNTYATARGLVGVGTTASAMHGLTTGALTAQRIALRIDCATSDLVAEIAAPATGGWYLVIAVQPTGVNVTSSAINFYLGNLSTPMALTTHASDANGSGAIGSQTAGFIGKTAAASSAVDAVVALAFCTPKAMTADQCERFRMGDIAAIWPVSGVPQFFVPMLGGSAATYDLAVPGNWTVTSTPTVAEDPPIAMGPRGGIHIARKLPTNTPKSVGGGITPTGAARKLVTIPLGGSL